MSARNAPFWKGSLVVLAGPSTVGEAERVVAALKARAAGKVVGEPTFGKITAQDLVMLEDGAGIYMSVTEYLGPEGKKLEPPRVQPDELVHPEPIDSDPSDTEDTVPCAGSGS